MAVTANWNLSLSGTFDTIKAAMAKQSSTTLAGVDYDQGTVSVPTTVAQVSLKASLATVGWFAVYNSDATNYIRIGDWNAGTPLSYMLRVPPLTMELFYLELAAANIAWIANTAACRVHFLAFER